MIIKVSRHIFGSHQGYRTLALSSDVTPEELAELETFAFGQTDDADYRASLASTPAYWSRSLSSGRRAISRVLTGPADEHGRQSLCFVTVLVHSDDWIGQLGGEDTSLLRIPAIWSWKGKARLPREEVRVSKPPRVEPSPEQRDRILSLLAHIETACDTPDTSIVVEPRDLTADELAMVVALLPVWYRPQFSYAARSLSEALPVRLNYLAECASRGKSRRKILRWSRRASAEGSKYAAGLGHFWTPGESPPWTFVHNCKAFGKLQPMTATSSASTGTPVTTTPPPDAGKPRRPRARVPMYVYWLVAVAAVIAATSVVVIRTVQDRRAADATLAAAEAFVADHPDPSQLPSRGSERVNLIRKAQSHAEKVAGLHDQSRAERQAEISSELTSWLERAGVRAEEYGSLDELLAGFDAFSGPLGLDKPDDMPQIPDSTAQSAVDAWKKRLENARADGDSIGEPYPSRIEAGIDHTIRWQASVKSLIEKFHSTQLALQSVLSETVPDILSNDMLAAWEHSKGVLAQLTAMLPPISEQSDDQTPATKYEEETAELRASLGALEQLASGWEDQIDELHRSYERSAKRAANSIAQGSLEFDPVRPEELSDPWKKAQDALVALDKALTVWPDSVEALSQREVAKAWMDRASALAMAHFRGAFAHAREVWDAEKQRAENASSNGVDPVLPNPRAAKAVLEDALNYWRENTEIIRHPDATIADFQHVQAITLYSEITAAEDQYNAAMKPPVQPPIKGTP